MRRGARDWGQREVEGAETRKLGESGAVARMDAMGGGRDGEKRGFDTVQTSGIHSSSTSNNGGGIDWAWERGSGMEWDKRRWDGEWERT